MRVGWPEDIDHNAIPHGEILCGVGDDDRNLLLLDKGKESLIARERMPYAAEEHGFHTVTLHHFRECGDMIGMRVAQDEEIDGTSGDRKRSPKLFESRQIGTTIN